MIAIVIVLAVVIAGFLTILNGNHKGNPDNKPKSCFWGHKWKFIEWSEYSYWVGGITYKFLKHPIRKCEHCPKYESIPRWYKKEFREMHPYDQGGLCGSEFPYRPEVPELFEN